MKKKRDFLSNIVLFSLGFCIIYVIIAVIFQAITGIELSPTLTERVLTVFGGELCATAIIKITSKITDILEIRKKLEIARDYDALTGKNKEKIITGEEDYDEQ